MRTASIPRLPHHSIKNEKPLSTLNNKFEKIFSTKFKKSTLKKQTMLFVCVV